MKQNAAKGPVACRGSTSVVIKYVHKDPACFGAGHSRLPSNLGVQSWSVSALVENVSIVLVEFSTTMMISAELKLWVKQKSED